MTEPSQVYDEMYDGDIVREHYRAMYDWLKTQTVERVADRRRQADLMFHKLGITFAVYDEEIEEGAEESLEDGTEASTEASTEAGTEAGTKETTETRANKETNKETNKEASTERLIPFDIIPRVFPNAEWQILKKGLQQRVLALNMFLQDVYHDQRILKDGLIPAERILGNSQYRPEMQGIDVVRQIYSHVSGIDIVRADAGEFFVLEDNLRVPSGVSYMLEDRRMMMRLFPELFSKYKVAPVAHYPDLLLDTLRSVAPKGIDDPTIVLMTPGASNSAYFEHAFLAQQMGVDLVEGKDMYVDDLHIYMRTTRGAKRVDVIYRRIDDDYLDPLAFRHDSTLGIPGLLNCYRAGHVTITNAIGTGIADDKSIYPYVPAMIKYYLSEEPLLSNVPTYQCCKPDELSYVLANMESLVIKLNHGAGGYGMLVGPTASKAEINKFRDIVKAKPNHYIAQPTLALSTCPTYVDRGIAPRHIDLRPFVLSGKKMQLVPGGLTRVALKEGSLVVNSSQGGGTKDTWVLEK